MGEAAVLLVPGRDKDPISEVHVYDQNTLMDGDERAVLPVGRGSDAMLKYTSHVKIMAYSTGNH